MAEFWENDPIVAPADAGNTPAPFYANDPIVGETAAAGDAGAPPAAPSIGANDPIVPQPGDPAYAAQFVARQAAGESQPQPATPPPEWQPTDVMPAWARAFSNHAVESVPVVGGGLQHLRTSAETPYQASVDQAADQQAPMAATAGDVFGTMAPLAAGAEFVPGVGAALGMEGTLPARTMMGAVSGGALGGADALARGDDLQDASNKALVDGVVGGAVPGLGRLAGNAWTALKGPGASDALTTALKADGIDPSEVNARLAAVGPGATVADLGPNTGQLAGALASLPGEPQTILKTALADRAAGTGQRLATDVANTLGTGQPIGALTDQIIAAQKAAADPLYAAVRSQPVQSTPGLLNFATTPMGKQAIGQAATMMQNDGLQPSMTVGLFDYAKQSLDDIVSSAQRAGNNNLARQATNLSATLRNEIDAQVPAYAQARNAFAGPAKVLDAVETGQSVFTKKLSPWDLQQQLGQMSASEKDGMLQGAQSAVQEMMGNARTDAAGVQQAFRTSNAQAKLALLIGPDQAQAVSDALDREARFAATNQTVTGNSLTASRLAAQKAVSPDAGAPRMANQTALGLVLGGLGKARAGLADWYRTGANRTIANTLTQTSLNPGQVGRLSAVANPVSRIAPATAPLLARRRGVLPAIDPVQAALSLAGIPRAIVSGSTPFPSQ